MKTTELFLLSSEKLQSKIKEFEGCRLEAYQDAGGVWTIGYGHTFGVRKGDRISQWFAEEELRTDILHVEKQLLRLDCCRSQSQMDALVSFVFNLGIRRLENSTLLFYIRLYNLNPLQKHIYKPFVEREFKKWVYCKGARLKGLQVRRAWEAHRFFDDDPMSRAKRQEWQKNVAFFKEVHFGMKNEESK
jgi:lysozyme